MVTMAEYDECRLIQIDVEFLRIRLERLALACIKENAAVSVFNPCREAMFLGKFMSGIVINKNRDGDRKHVCRNCWSGL